MKTIFPFPWPAACRLALAATLATTLATTLAPSLATAQPIHEERVQLDPDRNSASMDLALAGAQVYDYRLPARRDDPLLVMLHCDATAAHFNLLQEGNPKALFIGSRDGSRFEGRLPATATYIVRVYLVRTGSPRDEQANCQLDIANAVGMDTHQAAPPADVPADVPAKDPSGDPDYWQVTNIQGTLNVRSAPSTTAAVIGTVVAGDVLRNHGCRMSDGRRWCQVSALADETRRGWTAADFLVEGQPPRSAAPYPSVPPGQG